jgi:hypothetical protein
VGTYPSSCTGAVDNNYTVSYVNGSVAVTQATSSTSLTSNLDPSTHGNPVTFTATVSIGGGTVTFFDANGTLTLDTATLNSGMATLTISTLAPGSHSITATYNGNANVSTSTSAVLGQTVNRRTMTLPSYCVY